MKDDTISRQAAIDAMKAHRALYCDNTPDTFSKVSYAEKSRVDELDAAIATLVNLPSAQPEIIRCKECGHADWSGLPEGMLYCMVHEHYLSEDDYCSYGEKEDG